MYKKSALKHLKRGQGMVEFALALPIFLVMVIGVLEFGHLLAVTASVYTAAREAARYGSGAGFYADCQGIMDAADRVGLIAKPLTVQISYDNVDSSLPARIIQLYSCGDVSTTPYTGGENPAPRIIVTVTAHFGFVVLPIAPFDVTSTSMRTIIDNIQYSETPNPNVSPDPGDIDTTTPEEGDTTTPEETVTEETETPESSATPLPYCSFLSAGNGEIGNISEDKNTSMQNYSFSIISSKSEIPLTLTRFQLSWTSSKSGNGNEVYLTEIDFQDYKKLFDSNHLSSSTYDSGTISDGPVVDFNADPIVYFYFSAKNFSLVINAHDVFVYATYNDPGTGESVTCKLTPGQNATNVP